MVSATLELCYRLRRLGKDAGRSQDLAVAEDDRLGQQHPRSLGVRATFRAMISSAAEGSCRISDAARTTGVGVPVALPFHTPRTDPDASAVLAARGRSG